MTQKQRKHFDTQNTIEYILAKDESFVKKCETTDALFQSLFIPARILAILNEKGKNCALDAFSKLKKVAKYAPQNINIYALLDKGKDLGCINGKFSTFDYKLHELRQKDVAPRKLYARANKISHESIQNHSEKIAGDIIKLLQTKKYLYFLKKLQRGYNPFVYERFLEQIAADLAKKHGIKERVTIRMIETWKDAPLYAQPQQTAGYKTRGHYIESYCNNMPSRSFREIFICKSEMDAQKGVALFTEILGVFSHEFGHFVDFTAPDCGALGAQIMSYCTHSHPKSYSDYLKQPTEKSSYKIEETLVSKLNYIYKTKQYA